MLPDVLFFLLYFRLSDLYFSNQFTFRSFHCTSLALLSLKNTMYYGKSILDPYHSLQTIYLHSSTTSNGYGHEYFHLKCLRIIPVYFLVYIFYDLKHCHKRIDLLIHHMMCLLWGYINITRFVGFISFFILAEGITFAYTINTFKNQLIYRLVFTFFVRFPVWIIASYHYYYSCCSNYNVDDTLIYLFNYTIISSMVLMDCVWFFQNLKKLKQLYVNANANVAVKINH